MLTITQANEKPLQIAMRFPVAFSDPLSETTIHEIPEIAPTIATSVDRVTRSFSTK